VRYSWLGNLRQSTASLTESHRAQARIFWSVSASTGLLEMDAMQSLNRAYRI
jgi:hypothetical protein